MGFLPLFLPTLRASIKVSVSLGLFLFVIILHVEDTLTVASQLTVIPALETALNTQGCAMSGSHVYMEWYYNT